jgi:hypothetical protein
MLGYNTITRAFRLELKIRNLKFPALPIKLCSLYNINPIIIKTSERKGIEPLNQINETV